MDMSKFSNDSKSQARERLQWIVDVVREHQDLVCSLLLCLDDNSDMISRAKRLLSGMKKMDRDALLQEGGILTDEQIELLK